MDELLNESLPAVIPSETAGALLVARWRSLFKLSVEIEFDSGAIAILSVLSGFMLGGD